MCSYFYIGVSAGLLAVSTSVFAESASEQIIVGEQSSSLVQDVKQQKPYNPKDKQVAALQTRLIPYLKPSENIAYYQAITALTWLSYAAHEGSDPHGTARRRDPLPAQAAAADLAGGLRAGPGQAGEVVGLGHRHLDGAR